LRSETDIHGYLPEKFFILISRPIGDKTVPDIKLFSQMKNYHVGWRDGESLKSTPEGTEHQKDLCKDDICHGNF
jgi:hypothetical protein